MRFIRYDYGSASNGRVAKGCEHCIKGSKMVLFITGKCKTGCFYCPVSAEKMGKDVIYVNERMVTKDSEIIEEAVAMDATGTGITGGDPLLDMERTIRIIHLLKDHFGKNHHIHLYTSQIDIDKVKMVEDAGLDEIRFHPSVSQWSDMGSTSLKEIINMTKMDVGIEVPSIPGHKKELEDLIVYATEAGIDLINLNELEFSESNWGMMEKFGFQLKDETSSSIQGSEELAISLMKEHKRSPIHFCSSTFKDGVQLRNRLIRRAKNTAKPYDIVTDDGTILKGLLYAEDLDKAVNLLKEEYDVPDELMFVDTERKRMEIAPWVIEELAEKLPYKCYIIEEYSTADRLEVERTPLN